MKYLKLTFVIFLFWSGTANGVIIGSFIKNPDESYTYQYEVNNIGDFDIFTWSLELSIPNTFLDWDPLDVSRGGDVTVPLGSPTDPFDDWVSGPGIPVVGTFTQDFAAVDPLGSADVLIGQQLSGFTFTSFNIPGDVTYFEFGPDGSSAEGLTIGPTLIPEPRTVFLFLIGSLACFAFLRQRHIRS